MEDETNHEELQEAMACKPIIKSEATRDSGEPTDQPDNGCFILKKPLNSNMCDKAFGAPGKLKTPKRVHTDGKTFSCSTCGKKFKQSSSLKIHERIHNNEKPFSC